MSPFIGFSQSQALPKLGSDTSSVWNFCAQFSDVISRENQRWRREMSHAFSGYDYRRAKETCLVI